MHVQPHGTKELCRLQCDESGRGASRTFDSSSENKHKFSTLEKSDAMKMATVAMKGIDPCRVSKLCWVWLVRRVVKEYICNRAAWLYTTIICHYGALMLINAVIDT